MDACRRLWRRGLPLIGLLWACGGSGEPEPFLVVSGPTAVSRVELRGADRAVIWSLAAEPASPLAELIYGTVPAGFAQRQPPFGEPPRALVVGEPLSLETVAGRRQIVHRGYAETGNRFVIVSWETRVRTREPADAGPDAAESGDPELGDPAADP